MLMRCIQQFEPSQFDAGTQRENQSASLMEAEYPKVLLRDYVIDDDRVAAKITRLAWEQFRTRFADFDAFIKSASNMSELAKTCELIVAEMDSRVVGVVGYGPPNQPKQSAFDPAWAAVRMLSTHPDARGRGVGRLLVNECKRRARRDGANILALTTTKINEVALKMYLKMGFLYHSAAPPVATVPAGLYLMSLKEGVYS
jgi:GNAT superfamily N-acetyltransferase